MLASIPKVVGSIPTVARHIFQACPMRIYTQSNITSISFIYSILLKNTNVIIKTFPKLLARVCIYPILPIIVTLKPVFHMVITAVKIESQSFSFYAEIQHFRTENTRSDS